MYSLLLASFAVVRSEEWSYRWPYDAGHTCACKRGGFGLKYFDSQEACLRSFSNEVYETCKYKGEGGLTQDQCAALVAIPRSSDSEVYHDNGYCYTQCHKVIAGGADIDQLLQDCAFEFVAIFEEYEEVALKVNSCFSNYIYGYTDFQDPSVPLKILKDVETPSECQYLCQENPDCVYFQWRAFPDHDGSASGFQNPPHTCILHDQKFIQSVLDVKLDTQLGLNSKYCDRQEVQTCIDEPDPFQEFDLIQDRPCLLCECTQRCAFQSPVHVSGPAFCSKDRDLCEYLRPRIATTPEPECPTVVCPQEQGFFRAFRASPAKSIELSTQPVTTTEIQLESSTRIELESTTRVVLDENV